MSRKNKDSEDEQDEVVNTQEFESSDRTVRIGELDINTLYPQNIKDVKNGGKYIIIGKPGTGKSTLIKSIMYAKKHIIPVGMFFSGTEDSNGFFSEIVPDSFIYDGIDIDDLTPLTNFKKRQKYAKQFLEPRGDIPFAFEIEDDCTADPKYLKKAIVQDAYKNGRHWRMMRILSLQYCLDVGPAIRTCVDGVFILREASPNMRKKLYENFGSCVDSFSDWCDIMDQITDNRTALFINNKSLSNKIEDTLFYYKADPSIIPKDWKFGCKEYWNFHHDRYDENHNNLIL